MLPKGFPSCSLPRAGAEGRGALRIRRSAGAGRANPALAGAGDYFWKLSRLPGRETPFSFPSFTDRLGLICYVGFFVIIIYLSSLLLTQDLGCLSPGCPAQPLPRSPAAGGCPLPSPPPVSGSPQFCRNPPKTPRSFSSLHAAQDAESSRAFRKI